MVHRHEVTRNKLKHDVFGWRLRLTWHKCHYEQTKNTPFNKRTSLIRIHRTHVSVISKTLSNIFTIYCYINPSTFINHTGMHFSMHQFCEKSTYDDNSNLLQYDHWFQQKWPLPWYIGSVTYKQCYMQLKLHITFIAYFESISSPKHVNKLSTFHHNANLNINLLILTSTSFLKQTCFHYNGLLFAIRNWLSVEYGEMIYSWLYEWFN